MTKKKKNEEKNGSAKNNRVRKHSITFEKPTLTKQSFTRECSIVNIIQRYKATGEVPVSKPVRYGEQGRDFQEVHFGLAEGRSHFENLPKHIKDRYGTMEGLFQALETPEGRAQLAEDGILEVAKGLTSPSEEKPAEEAPTPSETKSPPEPPADPPQAENA